jgi:heptosyltransferase-3
MSNTLEYADKLTLTQWIMRAVRLRPREIVRRIRALTSSLPRSFASLQHHKNLAKRQGKHLQCIVLTDRFGDIIAAEPVARHLCSAEIYTIWLVRPQYQDLLRFNPDLDAVQIVSSYTETIILKKLMPNLIWRILHMDGYLCNYFGFRCKNPNEKHLDLTNYYNFGSLCDVYAISGTGEILAESPRLYLDPNFDAASYLRRVFPEGGDGAIIFHFVSDEPLRSWSADEARKLHSRLLETTRFNFIEVGLTPVLTSCKRTHLPVGQLPLLHQAALFGQTKAFVGVDSSFSHIANTLGTPSLLLLGEYKGFKNYLPWRVTAHNIILRSQNRVTDISADSVMDGLVLLLVR